VEEREGIWTGKGMWTLVQREGKRARCGRGKGNVHDHGEEDKAEEDSTEEEETGVKEVEHEDDFAQQKASRRLTGRDLN